MFPSDFVLIMQADDICPYDLARIVFVGHEVYDVPIFCKINGVSQSVTPYKRHLKDIYKPEFVGTFINLIKQEV